MKKNPSSSLVLGLALLCGCGVTQPVGVLPTPQLGGVGGGAPAITTLSQMPEGCGVLTQSETTDSAGTMTAVRQVRCTLLLQNPESAEWAHLKDALSAGASGLKELEPSGSTRTFAFNIQRQRATSMGNLTIGSAEAVATDEASHLEQVSDSQSVSGAGQLQAVQKVSEVTSASYRDPALGAGRVTLQLRAKYIIGRPAGTPMVLFGGPQSSIATALFNEAAKRQVELYTARLNGR